MHKTYNETSHLLIYENKISHIYKATRLTYLHMFWYRTFKGYIKPVKKRLKRKGFEKVRWGVSYWLPTKSYIFVNKYN